MSNAFSPIRLLSFLMIVGVFTLVPGAVLAQTDGGADGTADTTTEAQAQEEAASAESTTADAGADDGIPTSSEAVSQGETLFKNNCTVCHAINEVVVGPALKNVHERRPLPWLISFIRNSQQVIQSGDDYAVQLYNEYNKTQMPSFAFSDEEITAVLAYIKQESAAPDPSQVVEGGNGTDGTAVGAAQPGIASEYLLAILGFLLVILVLILVVLVLLINMLTKFIQQREGVSEESTTEKAPAVAVRKAITSRPFIGIMVFIFAAIAFKGVIDGLFSIGVQQGYQPAQPIAFSHKLHAGQYEIECNYCHTGVLKSKSANIPSANICMNCHNQIKTESAEIQKIYAALDYDPENRSYGENVQPIQWVRIHNLPDLVYFNHAQHVAVAGLECQTCHGEIQEMEVVYQASPLTMGWCINCHRETEVNTEGNAYYDKLVELHSQTSKEPLKVQDIGGLECSRCHY